MLQHMQHTQQHTQQHCCRRRGGVTLLTRPPPPVTASKRVRITAASSPQDSSEPCCQHTSSEDGSSNSASAAQRGHADQHDAAASPSAAPNNTSQQQQQLPPPPPQQQQQQQPKQQRKPLDVNRAVRLLKLTTTTSSSSNSDSRWRSDVLGDSSSSSSSGDGISNDASSSTGGGGGSSSRERMYSASDPIRRPKSRTGQQSEWISLPWQEGGDSNKEAERKFRRAVFSFERWAAHRSTWRYLRHFRGIISSRTLQGLLPAIAFFTGMAALAGFYNTYAVAAGAPSFSISKTSLDFTAFALSLLLVFRTDSSYARYEEALKTWNDVRSLSKDLARQSCYWVDDTARKDMLIRWSEAFSRALLVHCREDGCVEAQLEGVLEPHEVAAVAAVGPGGAPAFVLQVVSELIESANGLTGIKEDKFFSTLRAMGDTVAVCDKLLRYPLPLAWSRHTSRFMFLWLSALPFALWPECGWSVIPITGAVSYLLLGIDEIGVQIEEPLGILPLEDVCVDIKSEIDAMIERQDIVTDLLAAGGVDCVPRSTCGACGRPMAAGSPAAAGALAASGACATHEGL